MPRLVIYRIETKGDDQAHASANKVTLIPDQSKHTTSKNQTPTEEDRKVNMQRCAAREHQQGHEKEPGGQLEKNVQEQHGSSTQASDTNERQLKRKGAMYMRENDTQSNNHTNKKKIDRTQKDESNFQWNSSSFTAPLNYQHGGSFGNYYSNINNLRADSDSCWIFGGNEAAIDIDHLVDSSRFSMMHRPPSVSSNLPTALSSSSTSIYAAYLLDRSRRVNEVERLLVSSSSCLSPFLPSSNTLPSSWNQHTGSYGSFYAPGAARTSATTSSIASLVITSTANSYNTQALTILPSNNQHPQLSLLSPCDFLNSQQAQDEKSIFSAGTGSIGKEERREIKLPTSDEYFIPPNLLPTTTVGANDVNNCSTSSATSSSSSVVNINPHFYDDAESKKVDDQVAARRHEHFSTRPYMSLSLPGDKDSLSPFLCFLREECIEVFKANASIVAERKCNKIVIHQVGIRCRFCAHLPNHKRRAVRSSCFPSSTCRIYQTLNVVVNEHFSRCQEVPLDIKAKFGILKRLKVTTKSSKIYWKHSAELLGLFNTNSGMFMANRLGFTKPLPASTTSPSCPRNYSPAPTRHTITIPIAADFPEVHGNESHRAAL